MIVINDRKDLKRLIAKYDKVIVMYGASWCVSCIRIKPKYIEYSEKYSSKVKFAYVDVDKNKISGKFPYFDSFYKGEKLESSKGSIEDFREMLKKLLYKNKQ